MSFKLKSAIASHVAEKFGGGGVMDRRHRPKKPTHNLSACVAEINGIFDDGRKEGRLSALREVRREFHDRASVLHAAALLCETAHGKQRAEEGETQVRWCVQRLDALIAKEPQP